MDLNLCIFIKYVNLQQTIMNNLLSKRISISILLIFLFSLSLFSQDAFFNQYNNVPLQLNPALAGVFNGNHRILSAYRNQSSNLLRGDSHQTTYLSYDTKAKLGSDYIGLGIHGLHDKAGALELSTREFNFAASYIHKIGKDSIKYSHLSLALDLGISKRSLNTEDAAWPSQHDGNGGYDPTLPGGDPFIPDFYHSNFSMGLLWESVLGPNTSVKIGTAIHNFNRPNISYLGNEDVLLDIRYNAHLDAELGLTKKFSLIPSILYVTQGNLNSLMIGAAGRIYLDTDTFSSIQLGVRHRSMKGATPKNFSLVSTLDLTKFTIGLSYDFINYQGLPQNFISKAYEIVLGYRFIKSKPNCSKFGNT